MSSIPSKAPFRILLADDDIDDRFFFEKAIQEIPIECQVKTVENGEDLMTYLLMDSTPIPDILFLDISMPRRTGIECLVDIKNNAKLEGIPVVVFTTSFTRGAELELKLSNTLFSMGALDYIRKPSEFQELKKVLHTAIIKMQELNKIKEDTL
jgi:CheY-like chemotaxis protein